MVYLLNNSAKISEVWLISVKNHHGASRKYQQLKRANIDCHLTITSVLRRYRNCCWENEGCKNYWSNTGQLPDYLISRLMLREENQENQVIQVWGLEEHRPVIVVICFPENIITHYPSQSLSLILSLLVSSHLNLPTKQHWKPSPLTFLSLHCLILLLVTFLLFSFGPV